MVEIGLFFSGVCILAGVQNWLVYGQEALYKSARSFSYLAWSAGVYIALTSLEYLARTPADYFSLLRFHSAATFLTSVFFLYFVQSTLGFRARWPWWVFIAPQGLIFITRILAGPEIFYSGPTTLFFSPGLFVDKTAVLLGPVSWVYYIFALNILVFYCFVSFKIIRAYQKKYPGHSLVFLVAILVFDAGILNDLQVMILGLTQLYLTDFSFAGFIALTSIQLTRQALETFRWKRQAASQEEVLNHLPFLIALTDPQGKIIYLNPAAQREFDRVLWPRGSLTEWLNMALGALEAQKIIKALEKGETTWFRLSQGERLWAGLVGRVMAGTHLGNYILLRDLTAEETMEKKYQQIQNMENLGILAGGLAHDFRNCLAGIQGALELTQLRAKKLAPEVSGDILANLNMAKPSLDSANRLVQKILNLGKSQSEAPEILDLKVLAQEAIDLFQPRLLGNALVETQFEGSPAWIQVEHQALIQGIINLLQNGLQAMEVHPKKAQGLLTLQVKVFPEGDLWVLEVRDQGIGMDEATLKKLFQPFFTTKSQGTGLGLAQVWSLVHRSGGTLDVKSQPGKGSTFQLRFPVSEGPA